MNALQALIVFLVNAIWQICFVWAVAHGSCRFSRRISAWMKHVHWLLAIATSIFLPVVSLTVAYDKSSSPSVPLHQLDELRQKIEHNIWLNGGDGQVTTPLNHFFGDHWKLSLSAALYFLFVVHRIVRFGLCWKSMRSIVRTATKNGIPDRVILIAQQCQRRLQARSATILCSSVARIPFTVGVFKAVIVLPQSLSGASDEELRTVIAHEIAHIHRHDYLTNFVSELLSLPLSFHPGLGWMKREAEKSREMACDALAASCLGDATVYARTLLGLARELPKSRLMAAPGAALGVLDGNALEERVMELLDKKPRIRSGAAAIAFAFSLLLVAGVWVPGYSFALKTSKNADSHSAAASSNVIGVWSGEIKERDANGNPKSHAYLYMRLDQTAGGITGVIGPTEATAGPIENAVLNGNHLSFSTHVKGDPAKPIVWNLDLNVVGDQMTGRGHAFRSSDNHSWDAEAKFSRQE